MAHVKRMRALVCVSSALHHFEVRVRQHFLMAALAGQMSSGGLSRWWLLALSVSLVAPHRSGSRSPVATWSGNGVRPPRRGGSALLAFVVVMLGGATASEGSLVLSSLQSPTPRAVRRLTALTVQDGTMRAGSTSMDNGNGIASDGAGGALVTG